MAKHRRNLRYGVQGPPSSSWNHTELQSGPVVITASTVQSPCDLVEEAEFRSTLALSNQGVLWPEPGDEPDPDALYAILLHSRSRFPSGEQARNGHLPRSAYLVFPFPDLSGYAHEINLFDRFPGVVDSPAARVGQGGEGPLPAQRAEGSRCMRVGTPGFSGHRLREAREPRGLSAISVSALTQLPIQAVYHYEAGRMSPSPEALEQLAGAGNMPATFF